jgi:lantibiotic modifying enzyme
VSTHNLIDPRRSAGAVWQPILDGGDCERALELAQRIARAVITHRIDTAPTLLGRAGITVFCAYAESAGIIDHIDTASLLAECIDLASTIEMPIGLWNGCTGLRWAVSHLADGEIAHTIITRFDIAIERALTSAPADMAFDLYSGLAGILLAYAEDSSPAGSRIVHTILGRLAAIDWAEIRSLPGCAHGLAGVATALATFVACGPTDDRNLARGLLGPIVARLVAVDPAHLCASWCSGGPGVALGLLAAARALGDDELAAAALATALAQIDEDPPDATLCHGTAGLAHLCNRLYQATGRAELATRSRDWLRRTMARHVPGAGVAGFRRLRRAPTVAWEADPSVLVGAAGVGLALLAAATPIAPR